MKIRSSGGPAPTSATLLAVKLVDEIPVFAKGAFQDGEAWERACQDVRDGIARVVWPPNALDFTIRPVKTGNGVKPIKEACVAHLEQRGWTAEHLPALLANVLTRKDLDAVLDAPEGPIAFEWETGNISSSHRAINKLLAGFHHRAIKGAILVVPSRRFYRFLTDRIGNIDELEPYLDFWGSAPVTDGAFSIFVVEHDDESDIVELIPKGTDGMARSFALKQQGATPP